MQPLRFTIINCLTAKGDGVANDDVIGHSADGDRADFWVIDGATSVADHAYVPGETSDPAWFARTLASELARTGAGSIDDLVRTAIARTRDRYVAAVGDMDAVPAYAWPLAALTFVRVRKTAAGLAFHGLFLGDCPAFIGEDGSSWRPLWRPQENGDEPAYLGLNLDRATLKQHIRRRREEQHAMPSMGVVVPDPACVDYAKHVDFITGSGARLVLMSDGFARLFQEYRLMSAEAVMTELQSPGAADRLLGRLRQEEKPEAASGRPLIYKNGDDASVMSIAIADEVGEGQAC